MVGNKIIFNSNFSDDILSYFSSLGDSIEISDKKIVEHIGKKPWTLNEFKKHTVLLTNQCVPFEMDQESSLDIDSFEDLKAAEALLSG